MKNTYYLLSIFCLLAVGCKAQLGTNAVTQIQVSPCYLEEETFENTALRKFLKTSTLRRDIIENF
ncbi:hypothetical protein [Flavobacterium gelatinilyticum]|uniref:hypothetical protein n=1 Tax=Flavobacterium gelatinilyticum TaxID=3003260 RepID=UPI0024802445|nr:hypothetical protein [Flavobacterium gelatinilyticum]